MAEQRSSFLAGLLLLVGSVALFGVVASFLVDKWQKSMVADEETTEVRVAKEAIAAVVTDSVISQEKSRFVRFVVTRDHSASQTSRDQKVSAALMDSIIAYVYDPNKITVYQFGTTVRPIGTAANALERKQLLADWKAFRPTRGWGYSAVTKNINEREPLDDQFTNLTGMFAGTLPAVAEFAANGEYVCVIVLTDGKNEPPHRRDHPNELLENEAEKRQKIAAALADIELIQDGAVEIHVLEIGQIKDPGAVVDDILSGHGSTHQVDSWDEVAAVVAEIQRRCQGIYWWDDLPVEPVEFTLTEQSGAEPLGRFVWHASGPGDFRFEAESLDPLVMAKLGGSALIDDAISVEFGRSVTLGEENSVVFTVFLDPETEDSLPGGFFRAMKMSYQIKVVPVGNRIPFRLRQKEAGAIAIAPLYPSWLARQARVIAGVFGFLLAAFVWRVVRVRRQQMERRRAEDEDEEDQDRDEFAAAAPVLQGTVRYQGEEIALFGREKKVGHLTFAVTGDGLAVLAGNDMEVRSDPNAEPTILRAGSRLTRPRLAAVFTDSLSQETYEVTVSTHQSEEV